MNPVLLFFVARLTPKADLSCWNFAMRSYSNNLLEWYRCRCYNPRLTVPSLVYRYIVWFMVPSNDSQFCLYQHLVYVVKLASKGYIFFQHYPSWSSGPCYLANTDTDCSNAQPIMIAMSGTAATVGPRRRLGGGSMTTRCDGCSIGVSFWQQPLQLPDYLTWEMI